MPSVRLAHVLPLHGGRQAQAPLLQAPLYEQSASLLQVPEKRAMVTLLANMVW